MRCPFPIKFEQNILISPPKNPKLLISPLIMKLPVILMSIYPPLYTLSISSYICWLLNTLIVMITKINYISKTNLTYIYFNKYI